MFPALLTCDTRLYFSVLWGKFPLTFPRCGVSFALLTVAIVRPVCLLIVRHEWVKTSLRVIGGWWKPGRNKEATEILRQDLPSSCSITQRPFCHCLFFSVILKKKKKWWSLSSPLQFFLSSCGIIGPRSRFEINFLKQRGKDQEEQENNRQTDEDSERHVDVQVGWLPVTEAGR